MRSMRWLHFILSLNVFYVCLADKAVLASEPKLELSVGVHSVPSTVPPLELSVTLHSESRTVPFADKPEALVLDVSFRNIGRRPHTFKIHGLPAGLDVTLCTSDGIEVPYGPSGMDCLMPRGSVTVEPMHSVRFGLRMIEFNVRGPQVVLVKARWWHPNERRTVWADPMRVVLQGPGGEKPRLTPFQEDRIRAEENAIRARIGEHRTAQSNADLARPYLAIGLVSGAGGVAVCGAVVLLLMRRKRKTP